MPEEKRLEFISKIDELRSHIKDRHNILNLEALWLFVATLSCWSVNVSYIRLFAIFLVFIFFATKVFKDKKNDKTFVKMSAEIRNDVNNSGLAEDTQKARLHELDDINKNLLGLKSIYKLTPVFLLGYSFWAISLFYFALNL